MSEEDVGFDPTIMAAGELRFIEIERNGSIESSRTHGNTWSVMRKASSFAKRRAKVWLTWLDITTTSPLWYAAVTIFEMAFGGAWISRGQVITGLKAREVRRTWVLVFRDKAAAVASLARNGHPARLAPVRRLVNDLAQSLQQRSIGVLCQIEYIGASFFAIMANLSTKRLPYRFFLPRWRAALRGMNLCTRRAFSTETSQSTIS